MANQWQCLGVLPGFRVRDRQIELGCIVARLKAQSLFQFPDGCGPLAFADQDRAERAVPQLDLRLQTDHRFEPRLRRLQIVAVERGYAGAVFAVGLPQCARRLLSGSPARMLRPKQSNMQMLR